mgnify:CR=1 FL=1
MGNSIILKRKTYKKLVNLLEGRGYFNFRNYSVPKEDPLDIYGVHYKEKLREAIKDQMRSAQVVLVIAGKYVTYSNSINMELEIAREMGKPVIAIRPHGADAISSVAEKVADEIVCWNADSIVDAIRRHI